MVKYVRIGKKNSGEQEMGNYVVALHESQAEIIEKKSRFIATLRPVNSEEEAVAFIDEMKKKYWDARHNCSAFVIGENAGLTRCSDDGEPSGTAGRPMLEVLLGSGVRNIAVVVTRYFGGVLLGTGGLVRAYQSATKEALEQCELAEVIFGSRVEVTVDYTNVGKLQYLLSSYEVDIVESEYGENVRFVIFLREEAAKNICDKIIDETAGKAVVNEMGKEYRSVKI